MHSDQSCPQCGLGSTFSVCGTCLKSPPYFDRTIAQFVYDYPIDRLLQQFKYQQQLSHTATLADALLQAMQIKLTDDLGNIDLLIPMPMHPKRLQQRGFNQALEIAKIIGKQRQIPVAFNACQRVINTPPQTGLALKDRAKNIKGAFVCPQPLSNLNIAVIDDVMTSGASLNELARTLKKAGASRVINCVVARTLDK